MAHKSAGHTPAPQQTTRPSDRDWQPVRRRNRTRLIAAIVAIAMLLTALGGTVVSVVTAGPASAHDRLVSSEPSADDEIDEPVDTIVLTYSAEVIQDGTMVRLVAPTGEVFDADLTFDGVDVVAQVDEQTAPGEYVVEWRAVSSDGHPIEGDFSYTVDAAYVAPQAEDEADTAAADAGAADEEPAPVEEDTATPTVSPTETTQDEAGGGMPLVYGAVLLAIIGAVAVLLVRSRRQLHESRGIDPRG